MVLGFDAADVVEGCSSKPGDEVFDAGAGDRAPDQTPRITRRRKNFVGLKPNRFRSPMCMPLTSITA
jgi:hypothetical protein